MNYKVIADSLKQLFIIRKKIVFSMVAATSLATASMAQNVPNYVPTNGLVGWWPFNGNATDESVNTNDGTVNGATLTTDRFGNANSAYSFDGVNDFIEVQNNSTLNPTSITISGWIKNDLDATNNSTMAKGIVTKWFQQGNCFSNSDNYTLLLTYVNNKSLLLGATLINSQSTNALNSVNNVIGINSWKFFTFTHNESIGQKLFIDGVLINSNNTSGSLCSTTNKLIFGADNQFGTIWRYLTGKLDDIGIWNRELTQQEIKDLYNANICYDHVTVTDTLVINTNITGFNPVTYQNTIKVFPNPSNDHITIHYGNYANLSGYQLKITNSLGQQMFQTAITQQSSFIDLKTWTGNGIYFVHIIDAQGNTIDIKKIVLQ